MANRTVMTVLGPVDGNALGPTMMHEHLFFDTQSTYFSVAADDPDGIMANAPITPDRLWWVRTHPINNRENLVQVDPATAIAEVSHFKAAGGGTIVDVTTRGIAPDPAGLAAVARHTGVSIVAGTGYYAAASYAALVGERSVDALADDMRCDLLEGMFGTTIRAGIIGELGLSSPTAPIELRVIEAAARVQRKLDCAVSIHPAWGANGARRAATYAEQAGMNPARTVICHLDNRFRTDVAAYQEIASRGFWLEIDCCGKEIYYPHVNTQLLSDGERIQTILGLLDAGLADRLLLSQDICYRLELVGFGGQGYAHILRTFAPRLLRSGVDQHTLHQILVENPRAVLQG